MAELELMVTLRSPAVPGVLLVKEMVEPDALAVTGEPETLTAPARAATTCAEVLFHLPSTGWSGVVSIADGGSETANRDRRVAIIVNGHHCL